MAYTYLIGWKKQNKFYYGVRFAKNSNPSELWISYFTSSKHVKEFRKTHGDPDIIEIRKFFDDPSEAIKWETKVLTRLRVLENEKWINKSTNKAIDIKYSMHGWKENSRKKVAASHTGKIRSKNHRENISLALKGRKCYWLEGKKKPEHSKKMKGENNPRSLSVIYKNKLYNTLKDLSETENISYYLIKKLINSQEIIQIKKETENAL